MFLIENFSTFFEKNKNYIKTILRKEVKKIIFKVFDSIKNGILKKEGVNIANGTNSLIEFLSNLQNRDEEKIEDIAIPAYFTSLKIISQSLAKTPWYKEQRTEKKGFETVYDYDLDFLLNVHPNPYMTAITFWQTLEISRLHYGNSYVYIEREGKNIKNLWLLPSDEVEIWVDNKGYFQSTNNIWYIWKDKRTGKEYSFLKDEILHFKNSISWDGLSGIPIREILKTQFQTKKSGINFLKKMYSNSNLGTKIIVHYTGELSDQKAKAMVEKIKDFSKAKESGTFIPMPLGYEVKKLNLNLADNQFIENNKNNDLLIAAALGISPTHLNDYSKASYSNTEFQQLELYVNTLVPVFKIYIQELNYKLLTPKELNQGFRLNLDINSIIKMDNNLKSLVYSTYAKNFIMTPNEVRENLELPKVKNGDKLIGLFSIELNQVGKQYEKK